MKISLTGKLILLVAAVAATVALIGLHRQISGKRAESASLEQQITQTEQEVQRIQSNIEALGTDEGVKDVAHNQLGLVEPGETVFVDVGN